MLVLNLLSSNRRTCRPLLSPEFQHKDGHLIYGPPPLRYESESCSDSSLSAPSTPTEAHATLQNLLYRGVELPRVEETPDTIIYIDLLSDPSLINGKAKSSPSSTSQANEERSWIERGYKVARASPHPRQIRDIDPTITLISQTAATARSHYTVYTDDGIVHSESTDLELLDPITNPTVDGSLLYKTPLVPGFWETILRSPGKILLPNSLYIYINGGPCRRSSICHPSTCCPGCIDLVTFIVDNIFRHVQILLYMFLVSPRSTFAYHPTTSRTNYASQGGLLF